MKVTQSACKREVRIHAKAKEDPWTGAKANHKGCLGKVHGERYHGYKKALFPSKVQKSFVVY